MKKFLTGILVSTMVLGAMSVSMAVEVEENPYVAATVVQSETLSSGSCGENATYTFDESTGTLTISGSGAMEDYAEGAMAAPWYSMFDSTVENIIISDGITKIGERAFAYCKKLTTIEIPSSVTSIGNNAFHLCTSLTSVTTATGVTHIGDLAFASCRKLSEFTLSNQLTSIGESAFYNCAFTSITIPSSVTSIGKHAFSDCVSLTSLFITNSTLFIGENTLNYYYNNDVNSNFTLPNITVYGYAGSYAETWCNDNNPTPVPFVAVTEVPDWAINENSTTQTNPEAPQTGITAQYYDVVEGDTLEFLAARFNTTKEAIKEMNNLTNDTLEVGKSLRIPTTPTTPTPPTYSSWATSHIEKAQESDLIVDSLGMNYTSNITRSQIADLLVNMVEKYTETTLTSADSSTFTDTSDTAILKANQAGIISGMGDGTFAPNSTATREQIAMMIYKTILVMEEATGSEIVTKNTTLGQYNDSSDVSDWALDAVAILANNGIMEGTGDGNLSPLATASIEQGIILNNALFELNK